MQQTSACKRSFFHEVPLLVGEEPLRKVSIQHDAMMVGTYGADATTDSRSKGQSKQKTEEEDNLDVDLALDCCALNWSGAASKNQKMGYVLAETLLTLHSASALSDDR